MTGGAVLRAEIASSISGERGAPRQKLSAAVNQVNTVNEVNQVTSRGRLERVRKYPHRFFAAQPRGGLPRQHNPLRDFRHIDAHQENIGWHRF